MQKKYIVISVIAILFVGVLGYLIGYQQSQPEREKQALVEEHQRKVEELQRAGEVVEVAPEKLTFKVEEGQEDVGETISVRTNKHTGIQIGMGFVNRPGIKTDLTEYFQPGDYVHVMTEDGQAFLIYRELRPDEFVLPDEPVVEVPVEQTTP